LDEIRPNILLVMCDQLGAPITPVYEHGGALMPHLEALAARGTVFERAYCNAPLCAPSRASLMTGRLAGSLPVNDNGEELPASIPTFAHHLRRAGYRTTLSGKMHFIGPDQLHGFEERLTSDIYPSDVLWITNWEWPDEGHPNEGTARTSRAISNAGSAPWTRQMSYDTEVQHRSLEHLARLATGSDDRPWLLCVSFTQPHAPYIAGEEYWARYEGLPVALPAPAPDGYREHTVDLWGKRYWALDGMDLADDEVERARRGYCANASFVDDRLGELVAALDRLGELERTVVIFTSDHGDMLGEHGLWAKCTWREWSARVPLVAAGPGVAEGRRVGEVVSLVDLCPTLAEIAGAEMPEKASLLPLHGRSLAPLLAGDAPSGSSGRALIENLGPATKVPLRALVRGAHKYVYLHGEEELLFDLDADPDEWVDLAPDPAHAELLADLRAETLAGWEPDEERERVVASQRRRRYLREALARGRRTPWDFQPFVDGSATWARPDPEDRTRTAWAGE
jgi:choline-sulfatase